MHDRTLYRLTWLAAALSLGHHLDHLVRGNAVGWPVTDQVNAVTVTCVYETRRWAQQRQTRHAGRPAAGVGAGDDRPAPLLVSGRRPASPSPASLPRPVGPVGTQVGLWLGCSWGWPARRALSWSA
jgi:hypothetical protein